MSKVGQSLLEVLLERILTYSENLIPLLDLSILVLLLFTLILDDFGSGQAFIPIHIARTLIPIFV